MSISRQVRRARERAVVKSRRDSGRTDRNPARATPELIRDWWQGLSRRAKRAWQIGSAVVTVVTAGSAVYGYLPKVSIQPGTVPDDRNAMAAEFAIKNDGYVTLPWVRFHCIVKSDDGASFTTEGNSTDWPSGKKVGQNVEQLPPGREMRRNCATGGQFPGGGLSLAYPATYDTTVSYTWPWIGYTSVLTTHFASRVRSDGHVEIVPDFE
jgi:hypothetical protein